MDKPADRPHALYGPQFTWAKDRPWVIRKADGTVVRRFHTEEDALAWLQTQGFNITGEAENDFA